MTRPGQQPRRYAIAPRLPPSETELVEEVLNALGVVPTATTDWDLLWHDGSVLPGWTYKSLGAAQRINHFPGVGELTFKQRLAANLSDLPCSRRIIPETYCLPSQRRQFLEQLQHNRDKRWLLKPANSAAGRGVRLLADPVELPKTGTWLVQEYLRDPYLWRGRKFHLRLFMLITGFDPLTVYLHREGQVLAASKPYGGPDADLDDPFVHLTNLSVQHRREDIPDTEYVAAVSDIREYMIDRGDDFDAVWSAIAGLVGRMMRAVAPEIQPRFAARVPHRWNCFGLFGLDVLLDRGLKPWLLECNLSPSLAFYATDRRALYRRLISDMFRIVGVDGPSIPLSNEAELDRQYRARGGFERILPAAGLQ